MPNPNSKSYIIKHPKWNQTHLKPNKAIHIMYTKYPSNFIFNSISLASTCMYYMGK